MGAKMNYEKVSKYALIVYSVLALPICYLGSFFGMIGAGGSVSDALELFAWGCISLGPMMIVSIFFAFIFRSRKDYKLASLTLLLPLINFILMMIAVFQESTILYE
jgi:hypothetical protein